MIEVVKLMMICGVVLVLGLAALIAFPKSNLGPIANQIIGWGIAVLTGLYLVSPLDLAPEAILGPVGACDDAMVLVAGIVAARSAFNAAKNSSGPPARRLK